MRRVPWRRIIAPLLLVVIAGCGKAYSASTSSSTQGLADQCARTVGSDGYGTANLTHDLSISNERGEISVNCTIHLHNSAILTISNSQLKTRNLIVSDDAVDAKRTGLQVNGSTLTGDGAVSLVVDLRHPMDTINVQHSTLDYGLGVWMSAIGRGSGSDAGGGAVAVSDSTVRSTDPGTRGIRIVASSAGGTGSFINDVFQLPSSIGGAILYAGKCHEQNVTGAPPACSSPPR